MEQKYFGRLSTGESACLYKLKNHRGMEISLTDFGARLVSVKAGGRDQRMYDVVLGYDSAEQYENDDFCFGATIGRNANRIRNAEFVIDGRTYELARNENNNNSHSGPDGYHLRMWNAEAVSENSIRFSLVSPHMDQGFPGTADIRVNYELTEENEIVIRFHAVSDRKTVFNLTHHSYFNLDGHDSGNILEQRLKIYAQEYSPVDQWSIPTGVHAAVEGTPMDFREWKTIGRDIECNSEQLRIAGDYNHNFILDRNEDAVAAEAAGAVSGIRMKMYTDLPGLQLYTAKYLETVTGKNGVVYGPRQGFCLEPQYIPNAVNEPAEAQPVFDAGEAYNAFVIYRFFEE